MLCRDNWLDAAGDAVSFRDYTFLDHLGDTIADRIDFHPLGLAISANVGE